MFIIFLQSYHFDQELPGFSKFFKKSSDEERAHAEKLMTYQNTRGGRIVLRDVMVNTVIIPLLCQTDPIKFFL